MPLEEQAAESNLVAHVKLGGVFKRDSEGLYYKAEVLQVWKGDPLATVTVFTTNPDDEACGLYLDKGDELILLSRSDDDVHTVATCGGSAAPTDENIQLLEQELGPPSGTPEQDEPWWAKIPPWVAGVLALVALSVIVLIMFLDGRRLPRYERTRNRTLSARDSGQVTEPSQHPDTQSSDEPPR